MGGKSGKSSSAKIPKEYSAWTVGYDGLSAVVDKGGMRAAGKKASVASLLQKGLYRAAAAAAVNSAQADEDIRAVIDAYNAACGNNRSGYKPEDIYRLFGVQKSAVSRFTLL